MSEDAKFGSNSKTLFWPHLPLCSGRIIFSNGCLFIFCGCLKNGVGEINLFSEFLDWNAYFFLINSLHRVGTKAIERVFRWSNLNLSYKAKTKMQQKSHIWCSKKSKHVFVASQVELRLLWQNKNYMASKSTLWRVLMRRIKQSNKTETLKNYCFWKSHFIK